MKQLPLPIGPVRLPHFDNFVVGANAAAMAALAEAATAPGSAPVYLWGAAGSGKTHLLRAAARACGAPHSAFDADSALPWRLDDGSRLLLLDGCDAYDLAQQHAAFALFVEATGVGAVVLGAGRVPPVDLPVRDDLRTRLGWGLVFELSPPADGEAREALRRAARERAMPIADDVIDYLMTHFARDLGSQMALLDALDQHALGCKRSVTLPLLKHMLADQAGAAARAGEPAA